MRGVSSRIVLNIPIEELKDRIARVDIIGLDVDNCLIDGHGQIHVAVKLLPGIMLKAFRGFPRDLFLTLLAGGSGLMLFKLKKILGTDRFNRLIMKCFAVTLTGVEKESFTRVVETFDEYLRPGAENAILGMSRWAPVVLLSLGIEPVARWLECRVRKLDEKCRVRVCANRVRFRWEKEKEVFAGYDGVPLLADGNDKKAVMAREAIIRGANVPMIVGHDENDSEVVKWANGLGGLTVGFAPESRYRSMFHIIVQEPSWDTLLEFVDEIRKGR